MRPSSSAPEQAQGAMLAQAFQDFDQAATVLQQSYAALTARLQEMDLELAQTNATLRKHLKEADDMRAHVTAILESLDTGVLVADEEGVVTRANAAAEKILGISRSALEGRPSRAVLREANLDRREYPLVLPSGTAVSMVQAELKDLAGQSIGTLHLLHDVTRVRHLEERLQRRNRLAAMGEMIGCIAHEIRNPLGSVELFASMLRKDLKDLPHLRSYAEHISVAVGSMDRLLANLLTYMKPDCSRAAWHEMEPLIADALTLAAHALSTAGSEVRVELDPRVSRVWCDGAQLKQVLLNLVLNAVQAMPHGGTVTIALNADRRRADGEAPAVCLTVRDTGAGIAPEHQSRIFDPFFTTKDDGTGLGLAIVHALVEAHHGRIDVESTVGKGTAFILTLPGGPTRATGSGQRGEAVSTRSPGEEQPS